MTCLYILSLYLFSCALVTCSVAPQNLTYEELYKVNNECQEALKQAYMLSRSVNSSSSSSSKFLDPNLASQILEKLDVYKPVDDLYYRGNFGGSAKSSISFLALKKDEEYCKKHRAYFVEHPEALFTQMNYIQELTPDSFLNTKVFPLVGNNIQPNININIPQEQREKQIYDISPAVNMFLPVNAMNYYHDIGKHFSCITQTSSQIPGTIRLSSKSSVAELALPYVMSYKDRPQCLNYKKFFPKSWLLSNKDQCEDFFSVLNSADYLKLKEEKRIVFMRKIGQTHRGQGVQPLNDNEEAEIRATYLNGTACGNRTKDIIIQHYIHNPLLLNGNKFDFRMYLLIASTNPLISYYHDGFLRVSLLNYDVNSNDKKVLLTNLALNDDIYADTEGGKLFEGKDIEDLKLAQQWSFDRLQAHLLEQGIITDPNWLDNYLRPEFKKAMIHLVRFTSPSFHRGSTTYEVFGVDFMLDTDLNLWFIEANTGPAFDGYSKLMEKFIVKMLVDHFEIVNGLLRSRMKRIVDFVNKLTLEKQVSVNKKGEIYLINHLELQRETFDKITRNYFEKEFEPKPTNGFSKIIDENYKGVEVYQGLIPKECL